MRDSAPISVDGEVGLFDNLAPACRLRLEEHIELVDGAVCRSHTAIGNDFFTSSMTGILLIFCAAAGREPEPGLMSAEPVKRSHECGSVCTGERMGGDLFVSMFLRLFLWRT
jgi:hypothetical protein